MEVEVCIIAEEALEVDDFPLCCKMTYLMMK
jgi:hypothetical protein